MMKKYLKSILMDNEIDVVGKEVFDTFVTTKGILAVRDSLIQLGEILVENLDDNYYIAYVKVGGLFTSNVLSAVKLAEGKVHILAIAKEGLVKNHLAEKAIDKVREAFENE